METYNLTSAQNYAIRLATDFRRLNTPTAISGPAGSGKTIVAAEIAHSYASQLTLGLGNGSQPNVYFITYTNSLREYTGDRLNSMSASGESAVKTMTVHTYLREFLKSNGFERFYYHDTGKTKQLNVKSRKEFLKDYVEKKKDAIGLTGCLANEAFLDEEIGWMLGVGINNIQEYKKADRSGRRTGLTEQQREKVFKPYRDYMVYLIEESKRIGTKIIDFDDIGRQVVHYCDQHPCKPLASQLIIDEVQDLAKTWIDALQRTVSGKIVYAGDPSQSIYGRGFAWKNVTGVRSRPVRLNEDFRSTQQIYLAARSLMDFDHSPEGESGQLAQKRRDGEKPKLIFCKDRESQTRRIIELVDRMRKDNPFCEIIIGVPKHEYASIIRARCEGEFVTTLHSIKGLEADHVILANLDEDVFDFTNEFTQEDTNRHLLYVGMTRAKQTLTMMTSTDRPSPVLFELSADYVDIDDTENPAAHRAITEARRSQAQKKREDFEQLVKKKVESEEAVERTENELQNANDTFVIELKKDLEKLREQQRKSEERLQRLEDELRVYRAREKSDRTAPVETGSSTPKFVDNAVILILGGLGVKPKDIPGIFKAEGLPNNAFEHFDYDDVHSGKFDASELLDSLRYSDIFVSTTPHSAKGIGNSSSLVEYLEDNQSHLPKLTIFRNEDGTLKKASKTDLKEALHISALYAAKHGI